MVVEFIQAMASKAQKLKREPEAVQAPPARGPDDSKAARLDFLRMMLRELRNMSAGLNEPTLVYLVEMAAMEAAEAARVHKFKTEIHRGL